MELTGHKQIALVGELDRVDASVMGQQVLPVEVLGVLESGVDQVATVVDLVVDLSRKDVGQRAAFGRMGEFPVATLARLPRQPSAPSPEAAVEEPDVAVHLFVGGWRPILLLARVAARRRRRRHRRHPRRRRRRHRTIVPRRRRRSDLLSRVRLTILPVPGARGWTNATIGVERGQQAQPGEEEPLAQHGIAEDRAQRLRRDYCLLPPPPPPPLSASRLSPPSSSLQIECCLPCANVYRPCPMGFLSAVK